jgi:hypothetical protein
MYSLSFIITAHYLYIQEYVMDNIDLVVVKKADTGTYSTEVDILTADSKYQSYSLHGLGLLGDTLKWVELLSGFGLCLEVGA